MRAFQCKRPRVALYSHDTVGLGHIRRNQLIARALAAPPLNASVLLITGVRQGGAFAVPEGIDSLSLPAYRKQADGTYGARSLDMPADELVRLRSELIDTALRRFQPELLIADNVPRGACGELAPALRRIRIEGRTRSVLGLRDILDEPSVVRGEWAERDNFAAIRDLYDAVWIYGDPAVYATTEEYDFPADVRRISAYLGYLDPRENSAGPGCCGRGAERLILCSVGGGEDGLRLAQAFSEIDFDEGTKGLIVTGPLMPRRHQQALTERAFARPRLEMVEAVYDPIPLIRGADAVVSMAGYNSVNEIVSLKKRALLIPRTAPRQEQLIRAKRMAELGLADLLPGNAISTDEISSWIDGKVVRKPLLRMNYGGLGEIVRRTALLLGRPQFGIAEDKCASRVAACG